jgi:hypothetical protein
MKADEIKALIPTEAELCAIFMRDMNAQEGWVCYPETGEFDIVAVHESGRQIGVEAKLVLNAKVAEQIFPSDGWTRYNDEGPDHRLVIVRSITESNAGIARLLNACGVLVWEPRCHERYDPQIKQYRPGAYFDLDNQLRWDRAAGDGGRDWGVTTAFFDWNPVSRIALPEIVPNVPAGVPAPVRLTPWKQAAVRVVARLRVRGSITAKEIVAEGCSASTWTQRWLVQGGRRGQWVESDQMPAFDQQHPDLYAIALARAEEAYQAEKAAALL